MPARMVVSSTMDLLPSWVQARDQEKTPDDMNLAIMSQSKWKRLSLDWSKINVDACVFVGSGACSAVMQDEHGQFCGALC